MLYLYITVVHKENEKFFAKVPDLAGCITTGRSIEDAVMQITDAAGIWLVSNEDHGDEVVMPTPEKDIVTENGDVKVLIEIDADKYRAEMETPNDDTVSAFNELDSGGGETFSGSTDALFRKLSKKNS